MKKKILATVLSALLLTSHISAFAEGLDNFDFSKSGTRFSDVPPTTWYYVDVLKTSSAGIIQGIGNNKFNPNGRLTEAEAMTLMANVYAIYNDDTALLEKYKADSKGKHWADSIKDYCEYRGLSTPDKADFDTDCTREKMAFYFANSMDSSVFNPINDASFAPEDLSQLSNKEVSLLFTSGILIGDQHSFRLHDSITRAETAAIIHRVADPAARVTVSPKQEATPPSVEKEPIPEATPTAPPENPTQTVYDLRYLNIPHTRWNGDRSVSGNFTIQGYDGYIKTRFGNHTYGCSNQQEYDAVMKAAEEAYQYIIKKVASNTYINRVHKGIEDVYGRETDYIYTFLKDRVGLGTKDRVISWRVTQSVAGSMGDYLIENYAAKSGVPHVTDGDDSNVYKCLFGSGALDCDGKGNLYMLCYDYLGFTTRMIASDTVDHAVAEVYINGHWVLIDQLTGVVDGITHAELMKMISAKSDCGIKTTSKDAIVLTAKRGKGHSLSDLQIWVTPTHNPNDTSIK